MVDWLLVGVQGLNIARIRLSLDLAEQVLTLPLEEGVPELDLVGTSLAFVEVVHVKLPHERIQVTVLKVGWEGLAREVDSAEDFKTQAIGGPLDNTILF